MADEEQVPKRSWFDRRVNIPAVRIAFGADMREFALLWLVFGILDVLIANRLTTRWFTGNVLFAVAVWAIGAYLEMNRS